MNDFTEIEDMYILGLILEENHEVRGDSREEKFSASFSEIRQQIESSRRKELKEVAKYILHHDYLLRPFLDRYIEMILEKRQIDIIH